MSKDRVDGGCVGRRHRPRRGEGARWWHRQARRRGAGRRPERRRDRRRVRAPRLGGARRRRVTGRRRTRPRRRSRVAPHRSRGHRPVRDPGQPARDARRAVRRSTTTTGRSWPRRARSAPTRHRGRPAALAVGRPRAGGALGVLAEIEALQALARPEGVEVDTYDERFTTMIAQRNLRDATPRRNRRRRAQRERHRRLGGGGDPAVVARRSAVRAARVTPTDDGGHDESWLGRSASPSTPEFLGTDSPADSAPGRRPPFADRSAPIRRRRFADVGRVRRIRRFAERFGGSGCRIGHRIGPTA